MPFEFHAPSTFEEVWDLLDRGPPGSALPMAGGTDLLLAIDFRKFQPERVISLAKLPLSSYEVREEEVRIGSTAPLRNLELDPEVRSRLPALVQAVAQVGSVQLRHRATLGGNLVRASAASDLLPPLIALEARATLRSRSGTRQVAVEEFVQASWRTTLLPSELVVDLRVPAPRAGAYRWQRVRPANDISQVGLAAVWNPRGPGQWRLVAGGTFPTPQSLRRAESALRSAVPDATAIREAAERAAEEAHFSTDLRAAEDYRRELLKALVVRGVRAAVALNPGGSR